MNKLITNEYFTKDNFNYLECHNIVKQTLKDFDDGEVYVQESQSEVLVFDDGKIKNANANFVTGFGFRGVINDVSSFAHSNDLSLSEVLKAGEVVKSIKNYATPVNLSLSNAPLNRSLYPSTISNLSLTQRIALLQEINDYARSISELVKQVSIKISSGYSIIQIISPFLPEAIVDLRPVYQITLSVTVSKNGKLESASEGIGTRESFGALVGKWQSCADEAVARALVKLDADYAPAGELSIVLGNGDPGVLLHEAVGHGLEGDFNRMKTSTYSNLFGKKVAANGVTVIDDGTIANSRGSLNFDDEGTPTNRNILIEDGMLVGLMQDRLNARLMGMKATGNGRRESFAALPMPRMTNTFMLPGDTTQQEMIESLDYGIFFPKFGGGQVDITSGNFTFEAAIAYLIENGKLTKPLKGACLIGNGPEIMKRIKAIGNDLALDQGTGNCGKNGQSVPVGIGQPSLLIDKITVGGNKI